MGNLEIPENSVNFPIEMSTSWENHPAIEILQS